MDKPVLSHIEFGEHRSSLTRPSATSLISLDEKLDDGLDEKNWTAQLHIAKQMERAGTGYLLQVHCACHPEGWVGCIAVSRGSEPHGRPRDGRRRFGLTHQKRRKGELRTATLNSLPEAACCTSPGHKKSPGQMRLRESIFNEGKKWGDRRDSNPQQPEPQSGALPLNYGHHQAFQIYQTASGCQAGIKILVNWIQKGYGSG